LGDLAQQQRIVKQKFKLVQNYLWKTNGGIMRNSYIKLQIVHKIPVQMLLIIEEHTNN